MGKVRRTRVARPPKKNPEDEFDSDDARRYSREPQPDPESSEYLYDEVDEFDKKRTKSLTSARPALLFEVERDPEEEILPLENESDDEDDGDDGDDGEDGEDDDDMESDLDKKDKDDEDLPDERAWGARKRVFYDTEYPDDDRRVRPKTDEVCAEDEEEEEALAVQKRLAQAVSDDDLGLDLLQAYAPLRGSAGGDEVGGGGVPPAVSTSSLGSRVEQQLGSLSKRHLLNLVNADSPELLQLLRELTHRLVELQEELQPLVDVVRGGHLLAAGDGANYIHTKYRLCWNYCVNLSFYVLLKARRAPSVHHHPVVSRLLTYRSLLDRLSPLDERLAPQLRTLLEAAARNDGPRASKQPRARRPIPATEVDDEKVDDEVEEVEEEVDAETALRFYDSVVQKLQQKRSDKQRKRVVLPASEESKAATGDDDADGGDGGKRAITHQISRNRGLTAKRNKMDRNPRVKHREKFRRAKIRRAGQVRVVRSEIVRYGGEFSGIRAGVKKSIKLK